MHLSLREPSFLLKEYTDTENDRLHMLLSSLQCELQNINIPRLLPIREILRWLQCPSCRTCHNYLRIFPNLHINTCTKATRAFLVTVSLMSNQTAATMFATILCMNSGFSSVPANMPKNANAARLAISHAVHSLINLYICTLMAPGG